MQNNIVFGLHNITLINRTTGLPYGSQIGVVGSVAMGLSGETVDLIGGSYKHPVAVEDGAINTEMTFSPKEFPNYLYPLFLGKTPTELAASATGTVSTATNKNGTSAISATTGIATVTAKAGSETDLKFSNYVIKVVTATTVDVYAMSNVDFANGTAKTFADNETNKITSTPLTITASTPVEVPGFGVELTGGSGVIAMTVDDTATYQVLPPFSESFSVDIGGVADTLPEFGAYVVASKRGTKDMFILDIPRIKGAGFPHTLTENAFMESELKCKIMYDLALDKILTIRAVKPV